MVLVLGSSMQNMLVTQKLDIANLQNHMQPQAMARLLQHLRSLDLLLAQLWDATDVHEAVQGLDVVRIPLAVHASIGASFEVED